MDGKGSEWHPPPSHPDPSPCCWYKMQVFQGNYAAVAIEWNTKHVDFSPHTPPLWRWQKHLASRSGARGEFWQQFVPLFWKSTSSIFLYCCLLEDSRTDRQTQMGQSLPTRQLKRMGTMGSSTWMASTHCRKSHQTGQALNFYPVMGEKMARNASLRSTPREIDKQNND